PGSAMPSRVGSSRQSVTVARSCSPLSPRWRSFLPPSRAAGPANGAVTVKSMSRFYLTTPIYYVNSTPHIGHAYTTCAADILVRHQQQRGAETFFLTGVDEHATKVFRVAQEQGLTPQAYVDSIAGSWRDLAPRLNAHPDFF